MSIVIQGCTVTSYMLLQSPAAWYGSRYRFYLRLRLRRSSDFLFLVEDEGVRERGSSTKVVARRPEMGAGFLQVLFMAEVLPSVRYEFI